MKKVFLEDLPRSITKDGFVGKIIWKKCVNEQVLFIYNDIEGTIDIKDFKENKLHIKYLNNDIFKISPTHFRNCKLGAMLGEVTSEFKLTVETNLCDEKRNISIIDREYRLEHRVDRSQKCKYYKYLCNRCRYEGWMLESSLLKGIGCPCCCKSPQVVAEGINDIPTTASWMVKYFQGGYEEAKLYTRGSNQHIYPICPDCKQIKDRTIAVATIYREKSIGCSCGDGISYPNKVLRNLVGELLNLYEIEEYEFEFVRNWTNKKRYDAYVVFEGKEYFIEMDGSLGHGRKSFNGSKESIENDIINDIYKDKIAKERDIEVIRIDCETPELEYIKSNLLNSKLNYVFDLTKIDFKKIDILSTGNIVKEVCSYWRTKKEDETTKDLKKIFGVGTKTLSQYLSKGNSYGWCEYDAKKEEQKGRLKGKSVEVTKDGILLGTFISGSQAGKWCKEIIGEEITRTRISNICRSKSNTYKGLTFTHV